ncbi:MAG: hypothetical protein FJ279_22245 [Planctomycetes bacterium]|nr:hypothetical protein [Planctomycetota bacterium]MBM4079961.1 hypothetical protein [Planctomycetota bacterium]
MWHVHSVMAAGRRLTLAALLALLWLSVASGQPAPGPPTEDVERVRKPLLDLSLLLTVQDQEPLEKEPFYYLLRRVREMTHEELDSLRDPAITFDSYVDTPDRCRGKVHQVMGTLFRLQPTPLPADNPTGLPTLYEGQIVDRDVNMFSFYVLEEPGNVRLKEDSVLLNGVFLKVIAYKARSGQFHASPLLIGKRLVKVPQQHPRGGTATGWATVMWIGLAAVVAAIAAVALMATVNARRQKPRAQRPPPMP